ncbi:MAG: hypothetical protein JXA67_15305 [Micromonosporaceae bacterium]|nr:hypothetical protein [Micromonosporaceae bacterium]
MARALDPEVLAALVRGETLTIQSRSTVASETLLAVMRAFIDALRQLSSRTACHAR